MVRQVVAVTGSSDVFTVRGTVLTATVRGKEGLSVGKLEVEIQVCCVMKEAILLLLLHREFR
jgi:uncharacterized membrane protein YczE